MSGVQTKFLQRGVNFFWERWKTIFLGGSNFILFIYFFFLGGGLTINKKKSFLFWCSKSFCFWGASIQADMATIWLNRPMQDSWKFIMAFVEHPKIPLWINKYAVSFKLTNRECNALFSVQPVMRRASAFHRGFVALRA